MATSTPSAAPQEVVAGDLVRFTRSYPNYPSSAYTAALIMPGVGTFNATPDGDGFLFEVAGADTSSWEASTYQWYVRVTETSGSPPEIVTVDTGAMVVLANPANAQSASGELADTVAAINNIEAVLAKKATHDQKRYKIADRELERIPVGELLTLLARYESRRRRLEAKLGLPGRSGSVHVRFPAVL